ncbi:SWIM zinc finger family protein [Microlunatus spumicola]|uniref:SWIM zinc finger family protein n=1 Tax=Microlunatus spumicola TaxID=81499 RepID=A0ABP6WXV8_9ACTN
MAPVEVWSRAQVLAAAPDDASRRAATPLTATRLWSESGRGAEGLLWGRCRGSATYAVVADPGRSYACSCPSRKSPCKHALALLLRWADGLVPPGDEPAWVSAAAGSRREPRPAEEREPDTDAAAARVAERRAKVTAGLEELDRWLHDQVRTGLSVWERRAWTHVEGVAARMVDAQAPGVAGMLRGLPGLLARDAWPEHLLGALAGLHLLVVAHRGLDRLPDDLAATVRARVGYPVAKAAVLARPGLVDHWWALGAVDSLDGRLETRRVWLWGPATRSWALLLSFAVPGAGLDESVAVGQVVHGAVHRYPGAAEHRVLLGEQLPVEEDAVREVQGASPAEPVAGAEGRWAAQVGADPWATRMPAVLRAVPVPPSRPGEPWHLADPDGSAVRLVTGTPDPWPLLAASGGRPVDVFGEWGPAGFSPVRLVERDAVGARLLAVA